jgi:flagellar biosynthesis/type III secretory pathway chaperone
MESLLELKQTMTYMIETHHQLLDLARQKETILVDGKVSELQSLVSKESKFLDQILKLEDKREQVLKQFLVENRYKQHSLTMEQFVDILVDPADKQLFTKQVSQLRDVIHELSQLNQNNQELIQMSLSYIQYSMNILMPKEPTIGYGKESSTGPARLLDAKI